MTEERLINVLESLRGEMKEFQEGEILVPWVIERWIKIIDREIGVEQSEAM